MGMGADSDGPGGAGDVGGDSDIESSYDQEDRDAGAAFGGKGSFGRGGVGDDSSVPGGGFAGWGRGFPGDDPEATIEHLDVVPPGTWNDQPDIVKNYAAAFIGAVAGLFGWMGATIATQGLFGTYIDPIQAMDWGITLGYKGWGEYTSRSYDIDRGVEPDTSTGEGGDTERAAIEQAINYITGSARQKSQQAKEKTQKISMQMMLPQVQFEQKPVEIKIPSIKAPLILASTPDSETEMSPIYSYFNFPPAAMGNVWVQPKTSIWFT